MRDHDLHITRRRLPHWRLDGATYFITFRLLHGELSPDEIALVRDHIVAGHGMFYDLLGVVVMPDHVHAMLHPNHGVGLSRIVQGMKGASARLLNQKRGTAGSLWQDECWDRIVRDDDERVGELNYMLDNPVRKGLLPIRGTGQDGGCKTGSRHRHLDWHLLLFGGADIPVCLAAQPRTDVDASRRGRQECLPH